MRLPVPKELKPKLETKAGSLSLTILLFHVLKIVIQVVESLLYAFPDFEYLVNVIFW